MKSKILLLIIGVLVIAGLGFYFLSKSQENIDEESDPEPSAPEVILHQPLKNSMVESPLTISGEARGNWFFEANLPIAISDSEGNVLAQVGAQAKGDWMTTDYVPFEAVLSFDSGRAVSGNIIVSKDNPSGLPEHDASISFPIRFSGNPETTKFDVYFQNNESAKDNDCSKVIAVQRTIPKTQAVGKASVEELLAGPSKDEEKMDAYFTSIPDGVTLKSLRIDGGIAYADFSEELDKAVAGSCRVTAIRSQIEKTLKQFSTVNSVVISIDGETNGILQP